MNVAVIGAGISGLSFARYAQSKSISVKVFEKESSIGGIAKTKMVDGVPYHMIGGHCFNSKHKEVLDFVFNEIKPLSHWNKIDRNANILFNGNNIGYPIEYSIRDIFRFDPSLALNIVRDFFSTSGQHARASNLEDWFIKAFGKTLAEEYFIPYNSKIWGVEPSSMSCDWVVDKLPQPDGMNFLKGLVDDAKDNMPHSSFYYPKEGGQNSFIEDLAKGVAVQLNSQISSIRIEDERVFINDEAFDVVVSTAPLDQVANMLPVDDILIQDAIGSLRYNKVTTVLWESEPTNYTWTYIPSKDYMFHRMIHIGNFIKPNKNYTITETVGNANLNEIVESGQKLDVLVKKIDHNVSDHAYVVFDQKTKKSRKAIVEYLEARGIYSLGRFGQWDYFNMDICIREAMKLTDRLLKKGI